MNEAASPPLHPDATGRDTAASQPIRGDLTQGPILKTLVAFSIPMLISNIIQTLNGSINAIWVGRLIGESALAATASANMVMFLLFAAVFGFSMATTVRVGHYFGARDIPAARVTFGTGVGFCTVLAAATGVLGWFYTPALLQMLSTPEASLEQALAYLRVIFVTMPFGTISMMVSMGMRGAGDARTPLYAMILTVVLDIVLNPLLILGAGPVPAMGIAGSAIATAIANLMGATAMIVTIYVRDLPLRLRGAELAYLIPRSADLRYLITKGIPMGAQMLLLSAAGLIMIGLVNREGLIAAAAYGASLQLWNYLQMPAMAIASSVSAMVAQNIGAGNHDRVGAITRYGVMVNLVMTGLLALLLVLFDRPVLALFLGGGSAAIPLARHLQLICTWSFVLSGATMILIGTMRAYGVVILPLLLMAVSLYAARLSFYAIAYPHIGADAVWWAYPVGSVIALPLTWGAYAWTRRKQTSALASSGAA
jgi:putative MATE family efflux protein